MGSVVSRMKDWTLAEAEEGTYRQELDAWKRATIPAETRQVYRCPWPRCPHIYHQRADLHVHLDVNHEGNAP